MNQWIEILAKLKENDTMFTTSNFIRKLPERTPKADVKDFGKKWFSKEKTSQLKRIVIPYNPKSTPANHWISLVVHLRGEPIFKVFLN